MKFLFIFPTGRGFKIADKKVFPPYPYSPPLGILYLSTMLERSGHTIEVFDYTAENVDEEKLKSKIDSVDAVGITVCTSSLDESIKLAHLIKKHRPEIPLLIGGPHCNLIPERSLVDFNADVCVTGDGELIICKIADALQGKGDLSTIPGIYYKENGKVKIVHRCQHLTEQNLCGIEEHKPEYCAEWTCRRNLQNEKWFAERIGEFAAEVIDRINYSFINTQNESERYGAIGFLLEEYYNKVRDLKGGVL